jgi:hypothetical protein
MASMKFRDFPKRIDRRVYDEAVSFYTRCVAPRVRALYQVGNVNFPGLSDIDIVAVVDQAHWDNNQFFSPSLRLHGRHRALFHHGPRIIPVSCVDAVEVASTSHGPVSGGTENQFHGSRRRLLLGTDLLGDRIPANSPSWVACRVLEAVYLFRKSFDEVRSTTSVNASRLVSRAVPLRYPMRRLADLMAAEYDGSYDRALDLRRAMLLDPELGMPEKNTIALEVFELFAKALKRFEADVRAYFALAPGVDVVEAASDLLTGSVSNWRLDPAYIAERRQRMDRYHRTLTALGFTNGSIFATKPHNGAYVPFHQPLLPRIAASAAYRVRRSISGPRPHMRREPIPVGS